MQEKFSYKIDGNKVIIISTDEFEIELAEISYQRKIKFYPGVPLDLIKEIEKFAKYDNICCFLARPYEKALKPVEYKPSQWKAVQQIIDKVTRHEVDIYEYDRNSGDIYISSNQRMCRKLCAFLSQNGIRNSLQTDGHDYCTVIYSNLINQIDQLNESLFNINNMISSYQTIKVSFIYPLSEIDRMFDDPESWGVSTLKEWIDSYESSRFTPIGSHEAIITSEYNMDHINEWLSKRGLVKSSEEIN